MSEACYDVWFGHNGNDQKIGRRAEDVKIFGGVTRLDKVINENIRGTTQAEASE